MPTSWSRTLRTSVGQERRVDRRQPAADDGAEQPDQRHDRETKARPHQAGDQPVGGAAAALDDAAPRAGSATRKTRPARAPSRRGPSRAAGRGSAATASATTPTSSGAQARELGRRSAGTGSERRADGEQCRGVLIALILLSLRPTIQRAAKLTAKVSTKSTRPVAMSTWHLSGRALLVVGGDVGRDRGGVACSR